MAEEPRLSLGETRIGSRRLFALVAGAVRVFRQAGSPTLETTLGAIASRLTRWEEIPLYARPGARCKIRAVIRRGSVSFWAHPD